MSAALKTAPCSDPAAWTTVARTICQHSLFWLVAANSVGVLLAIDLLWPAFGDLLAPFTYGRWIPLHLNWQLYGWCSLPLVGVLTRAIGRGPTASTARLDRVAVWAWTLALAAAGISWLAGISSGKLFLDWHSWARPLLPTAMTLLWLALAWQFWRRRSALTANEHVLQSFLLLVLLCVPSALFFASGRNVYPSINPESGGATGASLLGSTLSVVALYGSMPILLSQPSRLSGIRPRQFGYWIFFAISSLIFLLIDHGHSSNKNISQQVGLSVLIIWIPLSWQYFVTYEWPASARRWLVAAFGWWLLLVVSGFAFFLPGISEHLKFTNGLVAHAHLALAGLVTCFNLAILNLLEPDRPITQGFWLWQGALALHITALVALGWTEYDNPTSLFLSQSWSQCCYALRLAAGLVMSAISLHWLLHRPRLAESDR